MRHARQGDLTAATEVAEYHVYYPSGQQWKVTGLFGILFNAQHGSAPTVRVGEQLYVLDPRAVLIRGDLIIYDPRRLADTPASAGMGFAPWVHRWLAEHREWPSIVTEMRSPKGLIEP